MQTPDPISFLVLIANKATVVVVVGAGAVEEIVRVVERTIKVVSMGGGRRSSTSSDSPRAESSAA